MRITIDSGDGLGAVDYTDCVCTTGPITVARTLNAMSRCSAELVLGAGLQVPGRRARVVVKTDDDELVFTGFLPVEPVRLYAGEGSQGPVYRLRIEALSDEWALNQQRGAGGSQTTATLAQSADSTVDHLTYNTQAEGFTVNPGGSARALGAFAVEPSADWSTNAGAAAGASYASVRVLDGAITVLPAGATTHTFTDADGTLSAQALEFGFARELANDVTVSGEIEPCAYAQEVFQGDGSTNVFELGGTPFAERRPLLVEEDFGEPVFSPMWSVSDPGEVFSLGSSGLTVKGGSGMSGSATFGLVNTVEMGGSVVVELRGVSLGPGSDGILAGMFPGATVLAGCFAGFRVRQSASASGGETTVIALVNGVEMGSSFAPADGHSYTLRVRAWCPEIHRVPQMYYCMVDGVVQAFGRPNNQAAPVHLVFEVHDEGTSSDSPVTVMYDTAATGAVVMQGPATCNFVAVSATSLFGSIGAVHVSRGQRLWVVSTLADGSALTRLIGNAGQGLDCEVSYFAEGARLIFFNGRVPSANERFNVSYRTAKRSVARLADSGSIGAETTPTVSKMLSGASCWQGSVLAPPARSSADCEAAAQAILALSTSRSAALRGLYTAINPQQDIWPGDVLAIAREGDSMSCLVRKVTLKDEHSAPEKISYEISFANDWATEWKDGLGLRLSDTLANDAWLPSRALSEPADAIDCLLNLAVQGITDEAIAVDAGVDPPQGGGFEVRLRDWSFGADGSGSDLVLRSPVRNFTLPRSARGVRLYVRMYDANTPVGYSRFSSVLVVNW